MAVRPRQGSELRLTNSASFSPPLEADYWIHISEASVRAAVLERVKARSALRR